jgi:hypothetical protein
VLFYPAFFPAAEADRLLQELRGSKAWRQNTVKFLGKTVGVPRVTAWDGDEGAGYVSSGIENVPLPWTPSLHEVERAVKHHSGVACNGVLPNRYRTSKGLTIFPLSSNFHSNSRL